MKLLYSFLLVFFVNTASAAIDPRHVYDLVIEGKAAMVDVREEEEVNAGMIDLAVWFPKSRITTDPMWLGEFLNLTAGKDIFLYCRSGRRSEEVRKILEMNGVKSENIGGYNDLKNILPTIIPQF